MNIRDKGLVLVLVGCMFLMLSFILPTSKIPTMLWSMILGISIIENIVGTGLLFRFLNEKAS